jgi:hypothetical protein
MLASAAFNLSISNNGNERTQKQIQALTELLEESVKAVSLHKLLNQRRRSRLILTS